MVKTTAFRVSMVAAGLGLALSARAAEPPQLNFYNWSDYIAEDTLAGFTRETGIEVTYDVFDSNEVLEAKLLAGNTGFDLVVPTSDFMARQIQAGAFMPLDKAKLGNYGNLDPKIMAVLADKDPGNTYGVPYLWGTTGIGYNVDKVREVLGEDAPLDSWDLVMKPENLAKLGQCGVAFLDAPTEIFAAALNYRGLDPNSTRAADYQGPATELMMSLRPHITYFHSSKYINDLANGDICVAVGWSGDILQARDRAAEAEQGVKIAYRIPKEGALMWVDMLTIPKDARHPDNAHRLIDYLLRPEVIAGVSNYVAYANANTPARALVDEDIRNDPGIYPSEEAAEKLYTAKVLPQKVNRVITRAWTRVKTGK
ncbi:putrescine transport system substrate-binding protein [Oceanisphaera litoralis]|uniref:extracellular solute-binding protein n=1 Tax=Oceanisphaera litoralis TaxID=225144 RepID=UPI001EF7CC8C|nr:extracellular solute-binding protein [Oceanisphaera litoralis]MBM7455044.1 putrescine transport system substrate-binding protein [Oceanisphaera litoralis]